MNTYVVDIQAAAAATPSTSLSRRRKECPARLDWPTWNRRSTSSAPRVYSTQTRCKTNPNPLQDNASGQVGVLCCVQLLLASNAVFVAVEACRVSRIALVERCGSSFLHVGA